MAKLAERERKPLALGALQRWFQAGIVRPHERGRSSSPSTRDARTVAAVVGPSRTLTSRERLALYSNMYFVRLHDCLSDDYPAVHQLVGDEAFKRLVRAYLERHPSRSFSLNTLGQHLPELLSKTSVRVARRALVRDVARLELAMSEVFDAAPSRSLGPADFAAFPKDRWSGARLRPVAGFRLLALDHPVNAIVTAVRQKKPLPELRRSPSWIAVYRKEYAVWRMDLTEPMHGVLTALARARTLSEAVRTLLRSRDGATDEVEAQVFRWFGEWAREGFFQAIEEERGM